MRNAHCGHFAKPAKFLTALYVVTRKYMGKCHAHPSSMKLLVTTEKDHSSKPQLVRTHIKLTVGCLAPKATSTISTPAPKAQRTTWKGAERLYDPEGQVICCEIVSRNAWRASLMLYRLYDCLNKT